MFLLDRGWYVTQLSNYFLPNQFNDLYSMEKISWDDHVIRRQHDKDSMTHLVESDSHVEMWIYETDIYGVGYKDHFLKFQPSGHVARFEKGSFYNSSFEIVQFNQTLDALHLAEALEISPDHKRRLKQVEHFNNFSLLLRNSEHVVKYILKGTWESQQIFDTKMNDLYSYYVKYQNGRLNRIVKPNSIPEGLVSVEIIPNYVTIEHDKWKFTLEEQSDRPLPSTANSFNVLLLGPGGSGKSNLVNHIFGRYLAESRRSAKVVTQDFTFYQGQLEHPSRENDSSDVENVCLIDTPGFTEPSTVKQQLAKFKSWTGSNEPLQIHRIVVVVGERLRDFEEECFEIVRQNFNFKTNSNQFTLVLTKCEDMDGFERDQYKTKFTSIASFENFKDPIYAKKLGKNVRIDRIMCVALKDFKKLNQDYSQFAEEREALLANIFDLNNPGYRALGN